ncbi:secretin and TonB N-terminal domain-containing protein [Aquincola sp. S2]|uniref:Secretin and TonB N-terminal domain-containing protein n=2 Tax=Pseudaquabacterium terrae TaxID=2732868 RepID=A0ABX2EKG6_9BURK|nr:secretin and TonB N-terminal domain-containing protein [Aquabacterium terrae]
MGRFEQAVQLEPGSAEYRIAYTRTRDRFAAERMARAAQAREAGDLAAAEAIYRQMLAEPGNAERAQAGLRQLDSQRRLEQLLKDAEASAERKEWELVRRHARSALLENPRHPRALALLAEADKAGDRSGEATTALAAAYRKPISIEFRDTPLKTVFEVISRSSGLNFVFDKDVRGDQRTSIFLKNTSTEAVLRNLLLTNQLEQRVLDDNSVLIYPNTAAKLKEYQTLVVRSFYLANADAKTVAATLKSLLKLRDPVVDEKLNLVIVRDSPEAIRTAERVVALHDVPEPEVMLEVEVLEVKRTRLLDLGVRWPDQLSLAPLVGESAALTVADLRNLNSSRIGASVGAVSIVAKNVDTDANLLANPRIRARNREKAKIHIGERVPNITTTSTSTGFVAESVTYVDVGLKLDVEPTIYLDSEVAIKVSLEVSNIINQIQTKSGTLAYQLGTRTASTVLRLKDGENQVLAGLISDEDRRTANKVPGLGSVPVLGRLFGNEADDGSKTEIVLSITPRIIRNVLRPSAAAQQFDSGTEASVGSAMPAGAPPAPGSSAPQPVGPSR